MRTVILGVATLTFPLLVGCKSVDPDLRRDEIRDKAPAALKVAICQPTFSFQANASNASLNFGSNATALHDALFEQLSELNTVTSIVKAAGAGDETDGADVYIESELLGSPDFDSSSFASTWLASGGLWLVSWIGGLLTDDTAYQSSLTLKFKVKNAVTRGDESSGELPLGSLSTSFWERNRLLSFSGLQSLILPPFWTSDDTSTTSTALTNRATEAFALRLANYLKSDFERSARDAGTGSLELRGLVNGTSTTNAKIQLIGTIVTDEKLKALSIAVNNTDLGAVEMESKLVDTKWETPINKSIPLNPGENEIHLEGSSTARSDFRRTLRITRS
ncbi:MAG: hypothetical protein H6832_03220 [Planctomycetes bacterium]|nr:hypothetical protein [Planctomycetota bacterium]